MENLGNDWIVEYFMRERIISSFAVRFDTNYAREEKEDWESVIKAFAEERTDYSTKEVTRQLRITYSYGDIGYYEAFASGAGIMVYHDEVDDTFYVGLIREDSRELFEMLFRKVFMENNSNKFLHLRRVHTISEDYRPIKVKYLKEAA